MRTIVLCLIALATLSFEIRSAAIDEVKIDSGRIKGAATGDLVVFKGIPFAAPPVGENRWRPPQPVKSWSGVRDALQYGPDAMQLPFPSDAAPLGTKPSEDCLYLNVWAPAKKTSGKLPVMIWIYGGGFVNGGSSPAVYDGSKFAERGVVFVSFNYRVGRFGFFAHPALTKEAGDDPTGNFTFMDQIAALKWVQRNIANFGGDPNNVTLFGESAGGISVLTMLTSPMAKGLFQKAIVESGGGRSNLIPMRQLQVSTPQSKSAEQMGLDFAKSAGISGDDAASLAALRALPADKLVSGLNMASMMMTQTYAGPMIDGKVVVEPPDKAIMAGRMMKIPIMIGANSSDIGFSFAKDMDQVFAPFGDDAARARSVYDPDSKGDFRAVGTSVSADSLMIEPARFIAGAFASAGAPAYHYRFSYVAVSMRKQWPGAPHATEIPFVFDTVAARYGADLAPADESTAQAANAYWVSFAKSGNPATAGLPAWPAYTVQNDVLMNFTADGPKAGPDPWKARLDVTQALADKRK